MKINLPKEVSIITRPAETKQFSELTIIQIQDFPLQKRVVASTKEAGQVELWTGDAYDAIGQWTDLDVNNRLIELYAS